MARDSQPRPAGITGRTTLMACSVLVILLAVFISGCSTEKLNVTELPLDPVILVDQAGQEWDVSPAVYDYGMDVSHFEFGLGKNAIQPLISPTLVGPGERGYPSGGSFLVVAVAIGRDARAYGMLDIKRNEVVDEVIGGAHVAVSY